MPNTMVAKSPPMNPSHVFLGDSWKEQIQNVDERLTPDHILNNTFNVSITGQQSNDGALNVHAATTSLPTLMRGVRPKKKPNM